MQSDERSAGPPRESGPGGAATPRPGQVTDVPTLRLRPIPDPLPASRLERLEIVDDAGRTRLVLGGIGPDAFPALSMYDEARRSRVTLALYDSGPQLSFVLDGFGVIEMGVADPEDPEVDVPAPSCT